MELKELPIINRKTKKNNDTARKIIFQFTKKYNFTN